MTIVRVHRFIRAVSSQEEFKWEDEDSLERLLQKRFSDKRQEQLPDGRWLLQNSLSLYRVDAQVTEQGVVIPTSTLVEVNALHTATAEMGDPNPWFLDMTDFIDGRCCPQEDSDTPFKSLSDCHHSLKFTDETDLRDWVRHMCQIGPQFHPVEWDDVQQYVKTIVGMDSLPDEWVNAKGKLCAKYDALPQKRKKNFAFWTGAGLLS